MKITVLLVSILIFLFAGYTAYNYYTYDEECLNEIAKISCEKDNLKFTASLFPQEKKFFCKNNERQMEGIRYRFIKKDLEKCKNE